MDYVLGRIDSVGRRIVSHRVNHQRASRMMIVGPVSKAAQALPSLFHTVTPAVASLATDSATASLIRGGAVAAMTEVAKIKIRLEGLHTYSVITTLLLNASLRLFSSTPKRFTENDHWGNVIKACFSITVTATVLTASYTTIVFSLIGLYTKRALGRGVDPSKVIEFFAASKSIRDVAYDTCLAALVCFQLSFVQSLFLNHDKGMRGRIAVGGAVAALLCWWKWSAIMKFSTVLGLLD